MKGNELRYLADLSNRSRMIGSREYHLMKAMEKHPSFIANEYGMFQQIEKTLENARKKIEKNRERLGGDCFDDLCQCELYEAIFEMKKGNWDNAVSELYDLIALCDRMICLCHSKNREQALFEEEKK